MDDFWPENKRFIMIVSAGLLVFIIGHAIINSLYADDRAVAARTYNTNNRALKTERYQSVDEREARAENDALRAAVDQMKAAVAFEARPDFRLDARKGTPSNQYFGRVDQVREQLEVRASRAGMRLPDGLGLEVVKTNSAEAIERHLEAVDLIDRVLSHAIDARVERVEKITVRLDPGFDSRRGLGDIERTTVQFKMVSNPESIVELLDASQGDTYGTSLTIGDLNVVGARATTSEVTANITFFVIRIREMIDGDAS